MIEPEEEYCPSCQIPLIDGVCCGITPSMMNYTPWQPTTEDEKIVGWHR